MLEAACTENKMEKKEGGEILLLFSPRENTVLKGAFWKPMQFSDLSATSPLLKIQK